MNQANQNESKPNPERKIYSVSQLNKRAKQLLETSFSLIWLEGEISNLSKPNSGHWYFTLKDEQAQIRCAMFKARNNRIAWPIKDGQKVIARAKVSLFEGRGEYQLIIEHLEEVGIGALQRAYEMLKQQLASEGLFDASHKKALPTHPKHIGLITSPTGAAVNDLLKVLKRRWPIAEVIILPVAVQGTGAANAIASTISLANKSKNLEAIIVGRGGGSLEDLQAFNSEDVARAIFNSRLPVISAVGHETDTCISDFVADYRAPTPSAAAEVLTPDHKILHKDFQQKITQLHRQLLNQLDSRHQQLDFTRAQLKHPGDQLKLYKIRLESLQQRQDRSLEHNILEKKQRFSAAQLRLNHRSPEQTLKIQKQSIRHLASRLTSALEQLHTIKTQQLHESAHLLNSLSPLATLSRGYSLTLDTKGKPLSSSRNVNKGDTIRIQLHDGALDADISDITHDSTLKLSK